MLSSTGNHRLLKSVIGVCLNGVQDALRFKGNLSPCPVAWQNRDAMVTHALSHMALLHERDPREVKKSEVGSPRF